MKTAYLKNIELMRRLNNREINASEYHANVLRRAELTLQRWCELECGDGNDYASWSIERDETTGKPYFVTYPNNSNKSYRRIVADREKGALRRIKEVCDELGINFFYQSDPRGCALYVSKEPLKDNDYSKGVACCS